MTSSISSTLNLCTYLICHKVRYKLPMYLNLVKTCGLERVNGCPSFSNISDKFIKFRGIFFLQLRLDYTRKRKFLEAHLNEEKQLLTVTKWNVSKVFRTKSYEAKDFTDFFLVLYSFWFILAIFNVTQRQTQNSLYIPLQFVLFLKRYAYRLQALHKKWYFPLRIS